MILNIPYKFIFLLLISGLLFSCTYEKIEPSSELPKDVSFKNDLIPLFNQSCNTIGCHNTGGIAPDLSADNAYRDLTTTPQMIDLDSPENSTLYKRMTDAQKPMPLSGVMVYESQQVLSWIKDGAKDN